MTLYGLHNEQYITGRELGRGGEGAVYEVQNYGGVVLKKYNEPLPPEKIAKLTHMAAMRSDSIEAYAAWPAQLVADASGTVCGFIMKRLTGFAPLHMIFSPMDRKKLFPDKGYNFLVHVARNLAIAFHKLHEAGLVIGDVNEGNILVNASGFIAMIDCDSFQVRGDAGYFLCEVGVPRYTPPELLAERSFGQVVRTANTDSFSLAVLLFQLLFLGRHPFAGKNRLAADLDEEKAIRQKQFAYSLDNKRKKLHPPDDSLPITYLPDAVVALFHKAFETDERPAPAEWVKALDAMLADMIFCGESRLHSYPARLRECPWCAFKQKRGILYFLDDTHSHATAALKDIESFVNGFNPGKLEIRKWIPSPLPVMTAQPLDPKFKRYKTLNKWASLAGAALVLVICLTAGIVVWSLALAVPIIMLIHRHSGWTREIKDELARRRAEYTRLRENLEKMIREHDFPPDLPQYTAAVESLKLAVGEFRRLPAEMQHRKRAIEERIYNEQLDGYLAGFPVEEHPIPLVGPQKTAALLAAGIVTAADISRLQHIKVPGIGDKILQNLMGWRRQMASGFVYIPDPGMQAAGDREVAAEVAALRQDLERNIRKEYQAVNHMQAHIANRATIQERQITDLSIKAHQANLDYMEFRKFEAAWW